MKTNFIVALCTFSMLYSYGQDGTYLSEVDSSTYVAMTIRMDGDTAYVFRKPFPRDTAIGSAVYYLSDLKFASNRVTIPSTGNYWFIPFSDTLPTLLPKSITMQESCNPMSSCTCPQPPSACSCYSSGDGANSCVYTVCAMTTGLCLNGGGIYIKASSIRIELGTAASYVEGNRFISTTVFIENNIAYVKKEAAENLLNVSLGFYNLANVEFTIDSTGKGKIVIPNNDYYWFIPFDDVPVFPLAAGGYDLDCGTESGCPNGSYCAMINSGSGCKQCACSDGYAGSCKACIQVGGDNNQKFCGSGIIVHSSRVLMLK